MTWGDGEGPDLGGADAGADFAAGDDEAILPEDGGGGDQGDGEGAGGGPGVGFGVVGEGGFGEAGVGGGWGVDLGAVVAAEEEELVGGECGHGGGGGDADLRGVGDAGPAGAWGEAIGVAQPFAGGFAVGSGFEGGAAYDVEVAVLGA